MNKTQAFLNPRRRDEEMPPENSIWLISFTDLMALMLTFFVMLYSMSDPQMETWTEFSGNMATKTGSADGKSLNRGPEEAINVARINYGRALDLSYLESLIRNMLAEEKSLSFITLTTRSDSLVLSLPGSLLFETGQAEVRDDGRKALYTLTETLSRLKNRIEIVGAVDPSPIISPAYASAWDLSLARAISVSGVLQAAGYGRPVAVRGAGTGLFDSLAQDLPEAQRRTQGNVIDIVVMEDDGNRVTVFDIGTP